MNKAFRSHEFHRGVTGVFRFTVFNNLNWHPNDRFRWGSEEYIIRSVNSFVNSNSFNEKSLEFIAKLC